MPLADEATVGDRIAFHRKRRGLSQAVLSGLLGRSEEWLSQIERGSRPVERLTTIVEVARALRIEPSILLPAPFIAKPRQVERYGTIGTAPEWVPAIRAAMMKRTGSAEEGAVQLHTLRRLLSQGFGYSQSERWSDLGPLLPDLLTDAHRAVAVEENPQTLGLLSLTYRLASGMLDRIGEVHLPWIAAERASVAADRAGDPLLIAGAAWRWSVVLRHAGELEESHNVPMAAAGQLTDASWTTAWVARRRSPSGPARPTTSGSRSDRPTSRSIGSGWNSSWGIPLPLCRPWTPFGLTRCRPSWPRGEPLT